jgi:hypothetical protein
MKSGVVILIGVVLLSIGCLLYLFVYEGFQGVPNWRDDSWSRYAALGGSAGSLFGLNADQICKAQQSCSACLMVGKTSDNHYGTECGWCPNNTAPGAWKCIPRSNTRGIFPSALIDIYTAYIGSMWPGDRTHSVGESCPAYSAADPKSFKYDIGQCPDACSNFSSDCRSCASAPACGWCSTTSTCVSKAEWNDADSKSGSGTKCGSTPPSTGTLSTLVGSNIYTNNVCSTCIITDKGQCPPPICTNLTDCMICADTPSCGWVASAGKCMPVDGNGLTLNGSTSGSLGSTKAIVTPSTCPCNGITDCGACARRPGCGYCSTSKKCINLDKNDLPNKGDCSPSDTQTDPAQCSGSTINWSITEGRGPNYGDRTGGPPESDIAGGDLGDPTYVHAKKHWNGSVRGAGDGPVSSGKSSSYINGNAIVRNITDESIIGINNSPDLTQSPVENYVRLLVRSELASEGIPTIEPFQTATEVIGNADKFLKDRTVSLLK